MATLGLIEYKDASPEVRAVYDDIMTTRKTDWINNFWKAIAHDPAMLKRTWEDVKQIISGSIGFDDWEWGVDLFADDPLVFKRLIYEMRFDEVSAVYALFGTFYIGRRTAAAGLSKLFQMET